MEAKRTIDEILAELIDALDNPVRETIDKKLEEAVFDDLRKIDSFQEYLQVTLGLDMKRYFSASTDAEREQIKGAFGRTAYLSGKIAGVKKNAEKPRRKRDNLQY